jgi:hypothetical protein
MMGSGGQQGKIEGMGAKESDDKPVKRSMSGGEGRKKGKR